MPAVRLVALVAALVFAAGCGGDDSDSDAPQKTGTVGGLAMYDVSSAGFEIGAPEDWEAISAEEAFGGENLDQFFEDNPEFEPYREMFSSPDSPFKFVAVDPDVQDDFATNMNVVASPISESVTFEQYKEASIAEIEALAQGNPIDQELVSLPAGRAFRVSYNSQFRQEGETRQLSTLQYGFLHDGMSYVVTYTTLPDLEDDYADAFDSSIRSLRFR